MDLDNESLRFQSFLVKDLQKQGFIVEKRRSRRQSSRLRGTKRLSGGGGAKFEIKHKSCSLQKSMLVNWGGPSMSIGEASLPLGTGPEKRGAVSAHSGYSTCYTRGRLPSSCYDRLTPVFADNL